MKGNLDLFSYNYSTLLTCIVAFSPMFLQYSFGFSFVLFPEVFFLLLLFFALLINAKGVNYKYFILVFIIYLYVLSVSLIKLPSSNYINPVLTLTTSARLFFYLAIVVLLSGYFKRELAAKLLVLISFFNAIYGLLQFYSFNVLGVTLPWYLPFLNVEHGKKLITDQEYIFDAFGFRFSGLFSEPAHFSQFVGFSILVLLLYRNGELFSRKVKFFFCSVMVLALLLSASGTGFFALMFIISAVALNYMFKAFSYKKLFLGLFGLLTVLSLFLTVLLTSDLFAFGVSRILSLDDNSSLYVRVVRPLDVFYQLDILQQIFGVGYGNFSTYLESIGAFNSYERSLGFAWTNSLGVFLVGSGLIGLILIFKFYLNVYYRTDTFGRIVVLFLLFHFFFSDLPHTIFFVCFMFFATSVNNVFNVDNSKV